MPRMRSQAMITPVRTEACLHQYRLLVFNKNVYRYCNFHRMYHVLIGAVAQLVELSW